MRPSAKIGQNNLINNCLTIFSQALKVSLQNALTHTLTKLFDMAEHAQSNQQEATLFEQYNLLKKTAAKLLDTLSVVVKNMPDEISEQISHDEDIKLSLVEDEVLEISLALTQLESVLDIRFSRFLFALESRLKIIFATRKISKENMPFGVASVCWVLSQTLDSLNSDVKTKVILLDFIKQQLGIELLKAYQYIDQIFVQAGILPNIKIEVKPIKSQNPQTTATKSDRQNTQQAPNRQSNQTGLSTHNPSNPSKAQSQSRLFAADNARQTGANKTSDADRSESGNLVNSIFELMDHGRMADNHSADLANIDDHIMDQTLQNLSTVTSVAAGSTEIDKLKEMILEDVRNQTGIFYPGLNQTQQNSLDVMGMFYDHVKADDSIDSNIVSSLNAINIPLIRTAIKDKQFFVDTQHPARQYLEKIIYAAQLWHGTEVVKKLHQFSSNLASEYDGSVDSFNRANEDLDSFLSITKTRAKKTEEKWVSSAKGKEKLEYSHQLVEGLVSEYANIAQVDFAKDLIKYVMQDALTLALLRHGEGTDEWKKNISMAQNVAKMTNAEEVKKLTPKQKIESLHHLDQCMDDLGFSDKDRQGTIQNIKDCAQLAMEDQLGADVKLNTIASISKNKVDIQQAQSTKLEQIRELTSTEKTQLTKLKLLPYGTLFDFILNQQRDKLRRKLSWFSPISNRALFVSLLGNKPYEVSLNAIAIDLARNNIVIVEIKQKKYFNQVMKDIFAKLKHMAQNN